MSRIVVGIRADGRPEPALDFAFQEASRRRLPLQVVHAYEVMINAEVPTADVDGSVATMHAAAHQHAAAAVSVARHRHGVDDVVRTTLTVVESDAVGALADATRDAKLLVVGARGGGTARRGLRGSVSAGCLHRVAIPVAVVSDRVLLSNDRWSGSRVLVGYDGSPAADAALAWGVAQAREWDCPVVPIIVSGSRVGPPALQEEVAASGASLGEVVSRRLDAAGSAGLAFNPRYLVGTPIEQLGRSAQRGDLLVLGSRGHGPLASVLIGSTSLSLAESAHCIVVVVRASGPERTPAPILAGASLGS